MPPNDLPDWPSRKRAAAILGVPADADVAAVRSAFLWKLTYVDFAPPEEWNAAATRLGAALPRSVDALAEYEQADVEEFLSCYWSLPPEARQARWQELDDRSRDSEVRAALDRVKLGLGVTVRAHEDAVMGDTARFVCELYSLPPREGAIRKLKWCVSVELIERLGSVGDRFRIAFPEMVHLVPDLMRELSDGIALPRAVEALDRESLERIAREDLPTITLPHMRASPRLRKMLLFGCLIALGLFTAACIWKGNSDTPRRNDNHRSVPTIEEPPPWQPQSTTQRGMALFTAEQIREFKEYDPKAGKPEPKSYRLWRVIQKSDDPQTSIPSKK